MHQLMQNSAGQNRRQNPQKNPRKNPLGSLGRGAATLLLAGALLFGTPQVAQAQALVGAVTAVGAAVTGVLTAAITAMQLMLSFITSAGSTAKVSAVQLQAQIDAKIANAKIQNDFENLQREAKMRVAQQYAPSTNKDACVRASGAQAATAAAANTRFLASVARGNALKRSTNAAGPAQRGTQADASASVVALAKGGYLDCDQVDPKNPRCQDDPNKRNTDIRADILLSDNLGSGDDGHVGAAQLFCSHIKDPVVPDPVTGQLLNSPQGRVYHMQRRGVDARLSLVDLVCLDIMTTRTPANEVTRGGAPVDTSRLEWGKTIAARVGRTVPENASEQDILRTLYYDIFKDVAFYANSEPKDMLTSINQSLAFVSQQEWREYEMLERLAMLRAAQLSAVLQDNPPVLPAGATPTSAKAPWEK